MIRTVFLTGALIGALATTAFAQQAKDRVVRQLQSQGFEVTKTERTLLGRIRLYAENPDYEREIVFDRNSGEILRDYWEEREEDDDEEEFDEEFDDEEEEEDEDDEDDDDDDDEDDDDEDDDDDDDEDDDD